MVDFVLTRTGTQVDDVVEAGNNANATGSDALLHSGNTSIVTFDGPETPGLNILNFATATHITSSVTITSAATHFQFLNANGQVGRINTDGTATFYITSSDPRLKEFKGQPLDDAIDAEFNKLFSCFDTFNWNADPDGQLVWGFNAHACIDAKLDMGSEGDGPRDLVLGDVYDITAAELDEGGNEIKPAIEHKVSPAGVDQAKAVPILLAKIEQLERRLVAAGL